MPVYDVGRFGERPFFTMKLVKGQTLAALLAARPDLSADRPRFLAVALQVAQALAYAHAKGVIHRDLKPANIMVGSFGEVQVMDWGLAKVLAEGGIADEERASRQHQDDGTQIRTARSSGSSGGGSDTEAGTLLGTPAYMPPEQANGAVATLDRRADVFGLGAILCEVLTGKPPYVGRSSEEVRRKAANGDLADATARLDGCGADAELVALTKACLSPEAVDRPADANAVAAALTAYLDGVQERLRQAELAEAAAQAKAREEGKRRRLTVALAATVLLAVLGGAVGAIIYLTGAVAEQERQQRNAEAVAGLLDQTTEALQARDAAKAAVLLQAAQKRADEGGAEALDGRRARLGEDLTWLQELDKVDQFRWTVDDQKLPDPAAVGARFRAVLKQFGLSPASASAREAAARVSQSAVRERLVSALDWWLRVEQLPWVREVLQGADPDAYRDAVRDALMAQDRDKLVALGGQAQAAEQPPGFVAFLSEIRDLPEKRSRELLRVAVRQRPGDLGLLMALGLPSTNRFREEVEESLRWYQAAVGVAPKSSIAHANLGAALHHKGEVEEAIACHRTAIALDPKYALPHSNLGAALRAKGQLEEAIACYRTAIAIDKKFARAHANLGNALRAKGQLEEAIACYRAAIALDPKYASDHAGLGLALQGKGQLEEAIACYQKAIAIDPTRAQAHMYLGLALRAKGQVEKAIASFRTTIAIDPDNAPAHYSLGLALVANGQVEEAITSFRATIAIDPEHVLAHYSLGNALQDKGQLEEAIASYQKAIAIAPKYAPAHYNMGNALRVNGQVEEAIACYRTAIDLDPKYAGPHSDLGIALCAKGQVEEAIASFRKAIALDPKHAKAHSNLGTALFDKRQLEEAIASYRKSIALDPKLAHAHGGLGRALLATGRFGEARDASARALKLLPERDPLRALVTKQLQLCERFLKLEERLPRLLQKESQPSSADESLVFAMLCKLKRLHAAAARLSADAFADSSKLADNLQASFRYNAACSAALAAAGQGEDAAQLDDTEKARLRRQALDWLRADLAAHAKLIASGPVSARPFVRQMLQHWQQDRDLASLRDAAALAKLDAEERAGFTQLWADVAALQKQAEQATGKLAGPVHEVGKGLRLQGQLDAQTPALLYQVKLLAGKTYDIHMVSPDTKALDPYLFLYDAAGKQLAENDDIAPDNLNARIVFRAPQDDTYRIEASSFRNAGRGAFTLTVREQAPQTKEEKQVKDETAKHQQAQAHLKAGKRELALPLLVEVVKLRKARLGPDHAETLNSLTQLGVVYWQLRQLDKSIPVFEEVLKTRLARKDGANHPDTLRAKANLGVSYKDAGRFQEALPLLEAAHRGSPKVPQLTWVVLPLLEAYTLAGEHGKLAQLLPEALPVARKRWPKDSPQLAGVLAQGGFALLQLQRWDDAEPLLRECLALREKTQPDAWTTANTRSILGGVLLGQKKYADAEPLLLKGYEGMKQQQAQIPPPGQVRLVEAVERLVRLYEALGQPDAVARWTKERAALKQSQKQGGKKP